jgi:hypothetical protein
MKPKTIKGYKAFNKGMKCQNFQYEEGTTYSIDDDTVLCKKGFHFCENPLNVLDYYDLIDSEFAEVESLGKTVSDEKKIVTNKLKIGLKIDLKSFIEASIDFLLEKTKTESSSGDSSQLASSGYYSKLASSGDFSKLASSGNSSQLASSGNYSKLASSGYSSKLASSGDSSQLASSGNYSQLASSGNYSKLASSGNYSKLASSGDFSKLASSGNYSKLASSGYSSKLASSGDSSQLASSGDYSQLTSSGDYSRLDIRGNNSVGANIGINGSIRAKKGCWITLAEYKNNTPICVKSVQVDGEVLKEDTWYRLINGKFTEV